MLNKSKGSPILRFLISDIFKIKANKFDIKEIAFDKSVTLFHSNLNSQYTVKSDGNTIIGRTFKNGKWMIISENISTNEIIEFEQDHPGELYFVYLCENLNFVISGGENSEVIQYDLMSGKILKKYQMNIGCITACFKYGCLLIIGGNKKIGFIDIQRRIALHNRTNLLVDCRQVQIISFLDSKEDPSNRFIMVGGIYHSNLNFLRIVESMQFPNQNDLNMNGMIYIPETKGIFF